MVDQKLSVMNDLRKECKSRSQALRYAGKVKRWHTEQTLQTQTISDHNFNILRIYYSIWGRPEPDVTERILFHDFEEYFIGDIPHWAAAIPEMEKTKKYLEKLLWIRFDMPGPSTEEKRIKICDWIEALEFMLDEVMFGNDTLRSSLEGLHVKLIKELLDPEEAAAVADYLVDMGFEYKYGLIIDGVHRG